MLLKIGVKLNVQKILTMEHDFHNPFLRIIEMTFALSSLIFSINFTKATFPGYHSAIHEHELPSENDKISDTMKESDKIKKIRNTIKENNKK